MWRPTKAVPLGGMRYRLLPTEAYDPEDEVWEFPLGTVVECESRMLSGGRVLVAARRAESR